MLQLGLALPQFLFLWWFIKLIPGAYHWKFSLILLLVLIFKVLKNRVDVISRPLHRSFSFISSLSHQMVLVRRIFNHVDLLEKVGVHRVVLPRLLEFLLCHPKLVHILILFLSV